MRQIIKNLFRQLFRLPVRVSPDVQSKSDLVELKKERGRIFPASIPRYMFWSNEAGGTEYRPRCHSRLESEYHAYLVAVRAGKKIDPFMTGNDHGYFCPKCPVVVLDREGFAGLPYSIFDIAQSSAIAVIGIVDIDAVPEDKKDVPVGDADNPIPLVEFLNQRVGDRASARTRLGRHARAVPGTWTEWRKR
jgi:hypothetical protein